MFLENPIPLIDKKKENKIWFQIIESENAKLWP